MRPFGDEEHAYKISLWWFIGDPTGGESKSIFWSSSQCSSHFNVIWSEHVAILSDNVTMVAYINNQEGTVSKTMFIVPDPME